MMSEAIDETLDKDEAEEETEELTNQVLNNDNPFVFSLKTLNSKMVVNSLYFLVGAR